MPWMTTEETADRYRITVKGLLKQRSESRPPGSLGKRVGKRVLWASEDLDAFDGNEQGIGVMNALVLEIRGINKRLDRILAEVQYRLDRIPKETEDE